MGPLEKVVRRLFDEAINEGRLDVLPELLAPTFRSATPEGELDFEAFKGYVTAWRSGFSDLYCEVDEVVEAGERIAWRVRARGQHTGEFAGIAPTHRQIDFLSLNSARAFEGLLEDHTVLMDDAHMFAQLGALPQHKSMLLKRGYEAFAKGDLDTVMELLAPEIVWRAPESVPIGGTFRGHEGVMGFFSGLGQHFAELSVVPERFIESGDDVVAVGRLRALTSVGNRLDQPFVHLWKVEEGHATSFEEFGDTATMARALSVPNQIRLDVDQSTPAKT